MNAGNPDGTSAAPNARTFRASTSEAALALIHQELGPEAMIVSVRQVLGGPAWQTWKKPEVEVLAIPAPASKPAIAPLPITTPGQGPQDTETKPNLLISNSVGGLPTRQTELAELLITLASARSQPVKKDAIQTTAGHDAVHPAEKEPPQSFITLKKHLEQQGLDPVLIKKVLITSANSLSPRAMQDDVSVRAHVRQQLEAYVRVQPLDLRRSSQSASHRVVCLLGPSGAGKTSTVAKIAALAVQMLRMKVVWVCADTVRTGAIALARAYTEPLGVELRLAYTPQDLGQVFPAVDQADLILVDMPACNPRRETEVIEMGGFLTEMPQRSAYLVAPATTRHEELLETAAALGTFNLNGLIITKLDEAIAYGSSYNLVWRSQLPLVYCTSGTRIIGDLLSAQAKTLPALLMGETKCL
jgi:flagellar biosynthesis protein FlhF